LHNAVEAKEGVAAKAQGRILGSITVQNLLALYPHACGMTGTAATQAQEFHSVYGVDVEVIATNRPVIREDLPDGSFRQRRKRSRRRWRDSAHSRDGAAGADWDGERGRVREPERGDECGHACGDGRLAHTS